MTNLYIGDFNGDGKDDFIRQEKGGWDDDENNTANLFISNGSDFTKYVLRESNLLKGDYTNLHVGDFNGDGKDNFIRQEKGSWDDDENNTAHLFIGHDDSLIIGDNVFIAGKYINVNGTVQAGREDHSAVINNNSNFQAAISNFNQQYANNNSKHLFDFDTQNHGITKAGVNDRLVRLRWNARDQRIEAHNVDVAGGNLELHGRIFSTGHGNLKVLDGYSRVKIENKTNHDLQLASLTNNGVKGRIKITDTSRTGGAGGFHVTEITRDGNSIFQKINGVTNTESGRTTTYAPKAKQVYSFKTSQELLWQQGKVRIWKGTGFGLKKKVLWKKIDLSKKHSDDTKNRGNATTRPEGNVLPEGSGVLENGSQSSNYIFVPGNDVTLAEWSTDRRFQGHNFWRTEAKWHWEDYRRYRQYHHHHIKADHAIDIEFIGYDQGIVDVNSPNSQVILDGTLNNISGVTSLNANRITATETQGTIRSNDVTLMAKDGISDVNIEASGAGGGVTATTTTGDLTLEYVGGVVKTANLKTQGGDIDFTSHSDINKGSFKADSIILTSTLGSIRGVVDTGNTDGSVLTATAPGDIDLRETSGDLRVNRVESQQGDVTLQVDEGDLIDSQTSEVDQQSFLDALQVFADDAAVDAHIEAIEMAKQAEYQQYWEARNLRLAVSPFNPADAGNGGVTLYESDIPSTVLGVGRYDFNQLGIFDNTASGVSVPQGYEAILYREPGFQGHSELFADSTTEPNSLYILGETLYNQVSGVEEIQIDDRITLNSHGFISGDEVVYQIGADTTAITREDALAGTNTVTAEHLGGTHQLNARYQSVEEIQIDDRITLNSHGFSSGDEVVYQIGAGTTAIDGLTADGIYYVHVIDANTIQLASTREDALAGTNLVNITVRAEHLGGIHQLNVGYQADAFDPDTYAFTYSDEQRAQLLANGKTDAEIATLESTQTQQIKDLHSEFGSPESYDPNYRYQVSQTQKDQLKQTLSQTITTLHQLNSLGNTQAFEYFFSLLSDVGLTAEEANAIGHDITLITKRGDVGGAMSSSLTWSNTEP